MNHKLNEWNYVNDVHWPQLEERTFSKPKTAHNPLKGKLLVNGRKVDGHDTHTPAPVA